MVGGFLMAVLGVVYLIFEDKIMVNFGDSRPSRKNETISRTLIGIQVSKCRGLRWFELRLWR